MAPLIKKIKADPCVKTTVCVTAQHREMLDGVLKLFQITPDYDLNLMNREQSLTGVTVGVLLGLEKILEKEKPDIVLVHGDTTTTLAAALAAFYQKVPVGHVEAGLRSGNLYSPFPEEMNRRMVGTMAALHFAPTERNRQNLLRCGVEDKRIFVTGNTVIDALHMVIEKEFTFKEPILNRLDYAGKKIILFTTHRRENWGSAMCNIFEAVRRLLKENPEVELVFPVHPNPAVRKPAGQVLGSIPRAHLIPPLDYASFANLMARAYLVLTDSGGIQEEAPALGKPVLLLRTETERPEAVAAGTVKVAGVERDEIYRLAHELLNNRYEYEKISRATSPYGDGKAAERIIKVLRQWLGLRSPPLWETGTPARER